VTYGVGFINGKSAYLIADSAISRGITLNPTNGTTSIGQQERFVNGMKVEEVANKINIVSESMAAIFAGDIATSISFLEILITEVERGRSALEAINSAHISTTPRTRYAEIEMILAFHNDGVPKLYRYNADGIGSIEENLRLTQIGSLTFPYKSINETLIDKFRGQFVKSEKELLTMILAYLYFLSANEDLIEMFVGGAFIGLRLDYYGQYWAEPALFVLERSGSDDWIYAGYDYQTGAFHVKSSFLNTPKVFVPIQDIQNEKHRVNDKLLSASSYLFSGQFYIASVSLVSLKIQSFIVVLNEHSLLNSYFSLEGAKSTVPKLKILDNLKSAKESIEKYRSAGNETFICKWFSVDTTTLLAFCTNETCRAVCDLTSKNQTYNIIGIEISRCRLCSSACVRPYALKETIRGMNLLLKNTATEVLTSAIQGDIESLQKIEPQRRMLRNALEFIHVHIDSQTNNVDTSKLKFAAMKRDILPSSSIFMLMVFVQIMLRKNQPAYGHILSSEEVNLLSGLNDPYEIFKQLALGRTQLDWDNHFGFSEGMGPELYDK